ncbi:DNA polymerase III subunit gamma/tau [Shewanella gaetbuli]|uniref:DNA-directed DNA polymerase n=1 Tax=Shewanella gaetbuli TaxID=220752 RepID=A0A9X2CMT4_9GAMM|nr:DNA polymerase III subunit gamma/tau [Shewanella gaetbuli]MCL1143989.1 DNA polymerase III subunit gamma/tau [Shewanella gaetbuli]
MSYQVLARKWRPAKFEQMVGQSHVLLALTNALSQQRLHHAYLFTGTRGVGKTSLARLFAKGLNCEQGVTANPCGVCSSCEEIAQGRFVDLIEVDAASRTKVDDTRELLDNVQYRPSRGRYKVYLIDEVHMLSRSSFNALLKTLEEPPEHVKFLLATTDPQKLPVTVLSRCLQFNLKSLSQDEIVKQLDYVLTQEALEFEPQALSLLAKAANGSMRDALSLTDQAIAFGSGQVMHQQVQSMLGSIDQQQVIALLKALCDADVEPLMKTVAKVLAFGADAQEVLRSLLELLHQITLTQFAPAAAQSSLYSEQIQAFAQQISAEQIQLYYQMLLAGRKDLPYAPDPKSGLEMALLRAVAFVPEKQIKRWETEQPAKIDLPELTASSQDSQATNKEVIETRPKPIDEQATVATQDPNIAAQADDLQNTADNKQQVQAPSDIKEPSSLDDNHLNKVDDPVVSEETVALNAQQAMLINQAESMGFESTTPDEPIAQSEPVVSTLSQDITNQPLAQTSADLVDENSLSMRADDAFSSYETAGYTDLEDEQNEHNDYEDYLAFNQQASVEPIPVNTPATNTSIVSSSSDVSDTSAISDNTPTEEDDILDLVLASRNSLLADVDAIKNQQTSESKPNSSSTIETVQPRNIKQAIKPDSDSDSEPATAASETSNDMSADVSTEAEYDRPPWEKPPQDVTHQQVTHLEEETEASQIAQMPANAPKSDIATPSPIVTSTKLPEANLQQQSVTAQAEGVTQSNTIISHHQIEQHSELANIGHTITGNPIDLHWFQIMTQIKVGGRVRQLGVNSLCHEISANLQLTLKPDQKHLSAEVAIEQLQAALSEFLGEQINVNVSIGQDNTRETPLELRKRFHGELVQQAKNNILGDDNIQWMINRFDAQLDDDSIMYPTEQLGAVAKKIPALLAQNQDKESN